MNARRLAIVGVGGRMGGAIARQALADPTFQVVAAIERPGDARIGQDVGQIFGSGPLGLLVSDRCEAPCDVLIEFSSPEGCAAWANWCATNGVALVSGTTGLQPAQRAALERAAARVPVVWSPNMSVGVNVLLQLVQRATAALGADWDVEIVESHHRLKVDAPSGTAAALLEEVCQARGRDPGEVVKHGRSGQVGPRKGGEIGMHALRLGDVVGDHMVHFASAGEIVTLGHRATSRDTFAAGALRAATWVLGRPAGLYHMRDVVAS